MRKLTAVLTALFLAITAPAYGQTGGGDPNQTGGEIIDKVCNAGLGGVLNKLPEIPGMHELKTLLNYQIELQSLPLMEENLSHMAELTRLANQVPIGQVMGQLNNISNLISGMGDPIQVPAILGGIMSQLRAFAGPLNSKLTEAHNQILAKYNEYQILYQNETNQAKKEMYLVQAQAKLQEMQQIQNFIGSQAALNQGMGQANQQLNSLLNNSELGKVTNELKGLLDKYQLKQLAGEAVQEFIQVAKTLKGLRDLMELKEELDPICGLLPDGDLKTKVETLIHNQLNGELNNAVNRLKELLNQLIQKASNAVSTGSTNLTESELVGQITGGVTVAVLEELVNSLINLVPEKLAGILMPFRYGGLANVRQFVNPKVSCDYLNDAANGYVHQAYNQAQGEVNLKLANMAGGIFNNSVNLARPGNISVCVIKQ